MDDRRFDSLARSLANGASRRSVLKGILGLGSAALAGGVLLEGDTDAAKRPTPTPKPVKCPGNQIPVGGVCTCPAGAPNKCGPACCTGKPGDPPNPSHTECCDGACCHGTCYGEELCCPTNPGQGEQPPTHQICRSAQGVECCPADQDCCEVDGCCDTVCWGGADDNSNCCPRGAFCPGGGGSADICCTNNFICCGAGTSGNLCRDPNVANGCCSTADCPSGQVCESNLCVTPCTSKVSVLVHAPSNGCSQGTSLSGVPVALYDCDSGDVLFGPVASNNDGSVDFASVPPGTYCVAVPGDSPYSDCLSCRDNPLYRTQIEVVCGRTSYPLIGICQQGQHCDEGVCEVDDPCEGRCTDLEVCVDFGCYCRPGTYDDSEEGCIICGPGTYSDSRGALECFSCDLATYQDQSGQTGCISCPEGTYTEHVGSTAATQCLACNCEAGNMPAICGCPVVCDVGSAPNESGVCALCPAGTYSSDGTACTPCGVGTFNDTPGNYTCLDCPTGSYSGAPGAEQCTLCGAGTYNDIVGNYTCLDCPAGSYAAAPGAIACTLCAPGSYNDIVANYQCFQCFVGSYAADAGSAQCTPCAAGTYAGQVGSAACVTCDCGATCNPVSGTCGSVGVGGACESDSDCFSNICGCDSPPGLPECMCREETCWATGQNCASGHGAVSCCTGDCTCFGGITNCVCTVPV